jgi:SAM-dependent methyltransferase
MSELVCTHAALATVEELFRYKSEGFQLPPFGGYSTDQWGIKAHNRPWVAAHGRWAAGQRVIEPGGAYSRLPEWLGTEYGVEPWIGDDFGASTSEDLWARWGDPGELPTRYPSVKYRFENFGPGSSYPSAHFDRIFTVSTLEHIPRADRPPLLRDIHRCLAPGGLELHTIDINIPKPWQVMVSAGAELLRVGRALDRLYQNSIGAWVRLFQRSGVKFETAVPTTLRLLDRSVLVESPDVVYRLYPPLDSPKPYRPSASLLLIIEDRSAAQELRRC